MTSGDVLVILLYAALLTIPAFTTSATCPSVPGTETTDCSVPETDELSAIRREVFGGGRIIDISHRYTPDMPSCLSNDCVGQFLWLRKSMKNGSIANFSEMILPTHTGTHVDAPGHFHDHYFDAGFDVDTLDLEVLNGPALLVDVPREKNITGEFAVSFSELQILKEDGAKWLVENTDIKLVGIDYLSVASYDYLAAAHFVLLEGRDIIPVEALKLDGVPAGLYSIRCLPLRLLGAEGSPIRCILIKQ